MSVYTLDPLQDRRWGEFVEGHPAGSVYHTAGWVEALRRTYRYEPIVYTTTPPGAVLTNGVLLCGVRSWLTGHRLVSVPFADHCNVLVTTPDDGAALVDALHAALSQWRYVELRPAAGSLDDARLQPAETFRLHTLDLQPALEDIYRQTHPSGIQRKVRRAEREGLTCEEGRSAALLRAFYELMLLTRRRHTLPPQPREWFANVIACLGDRVTLRVAMKNGRPIGSIMTLRHRDTVVYKYGCSDAAFHRYGVMPFLFWRAIRDAKAGGVRTFDLGRSSADNTGLIAFKEHMGARAGTLTYLRLSHRRVASRKLPTHLAAQIFAHLPDPLLIAAGRFLYPHLG